jgi:hypothetical protein
LERTEPILATELAPAAARPAPRFGIPEVYALIALGSFLVARFFPVLHLHYECPFRSLTGLPCATCGMTHAFVYLAHGQVAAALRWSPLGTLLAAGAWAFALAAAVRLASGRTWPAPSRRTAQRAVIALAAALVANWAFLLIHGLGP